MREKVIVSIRGIHHTEEDDSVEVVSMGEMLKKEDAIYVCYEEASDEADGEDCEIVKSLMKVKPGQVEIIKKGPTETHMIFVEGKDTMSYYSTPFGELEVVIHTKRLECLESDSGFHIELEYALEVNAAHMSDCNVDIKVEWKRG